MFGAEWGPGPVERVIRRSRRHSNSLWRSPSLATLFPLKAIIIGLLPQWLPLYSYWPSTKAFFNFFGPQNLSESRFYRVLQSPIYWL